MAFQYWANQARDAGRDPRATGRTTYLALGNSYHGDTVGAISLGAGGFGTDIFDPLRFPVLRTPGYDDPAWADAAVEQLERHHAELAAVVLEPLVQGAAGMLTHPAGYLRQVRELCDRFGVLLICDEVATGFGRTGKMFACEHEDVAPDLLCIAKGLTGGYLPLAATLATERIYEGFLGAPEEYRTFFHGHTYTGNPLACAAALASLDVFEQERTIEQLQPKIRLLRELLDEVEAMPEVTEVRGRGFMVGIDLGEHDPALRMGHRVTLEARKRGAIIRPLTDTVILVPPLSISEDELRNLVEITRESILAACSSEAAAPAHFAQAA
jgi:adenosylmethionine-8-amino-7-oxononanoate aminotransferase